MTKGIRASVATLNITPLDYRGNAGKIVAAIGEAKADKSSVLLAPEMALCGYQIMDYVFLEETCRRSFQAFVDWVLPETDHLVLAVGLPVLFKNSVYNAVVVAANRRILGIRFKKRLANSGNHYEARWFKTPVDDEYGWFIPDVEYDFEEEYLAEYKDLLSTPVKVGDVYFNVGGVTIGLEICEEAWGSNNEMELAGKRGYDLLLNPSASHFQIGKQITRETIARRASFGCPYLLSNCVGVQSASTIYDGGSLVAVSGMIVARGKRASLELVEVTTTEINLFGACRDRMEAHHTRAELPDHDCLVTYSDFVWPDVLALPSVEAPDPENWSLLHGNDYGEFLQAQTLGILDQLEKSHLSGLLVSLSGGKDSTTVAYLSALAIRRGVRELGIAEMHRRFQHVPGIESAETEADFVQLMVRTVYQNTRNNSKTTRDAARKISASLGVTYNFLSVDPIINVVHLIINACFRVTLDPVKHDVTVQNIQARVRGLIIWTVANLFNFLLLSCGNQTESALGFCTMGGDTAGGLNPLSGTSKSFIIDLLEYLEVGDTHLTQPMPELACVNSQKPSAELKKGQTDEGDLGPFPVLDFITRVFGQERSGPGRTFKLVVRKFGDSYSIKDLLEYTRRYFRLFARNQWKRVQLPDGFHMFGMSLDPRTWGRFPKFTSGFQEEIEDMEYYAEKLEKSDGSKVL